MHLKLQAREKHCITRRESHTNQRKVTKLEAMHNQINRGQVKDWVPRIQQKRRQTEYMSIMKDILERDKVIRYSNNCEADQIVTTLSIAWNYSPVQVHKKQRKEQNKMLQLMKNLVMT